jgi:DNA topoisomerase II
MSSPSLSAKYQQKTDKEHILQNPDTYIGSVENIQCSNQWVYDEINKQITVKQIEVVNLALLKLFDEGIVNCRDHYIRCKATPDSSKVSYISITIDKTTGLITLENDGNGIDVVEHPEYKVWIPELIFGHLRTSTNYDKSEKKIVGGKNGFGFKLVLIWSTFGSIETVDHVRKLKYTQDFHDNLETISKPKISNSGEKKPYTRVSFRPDYERLGIQLTDEMVSVMEKRIMDIAAMTDATVKVKYNGKTVPIKTFANYVELYIGKQKRVYEKCGERWEVIVTVASDEFQQVSFVNGICTYKGGKHVDYILNQITRKLTQFIEKKKKVNVTQSSIKEQLFLFLRCDIENPTFDSQSKDFLTTPFQNFGSTCTISDDFIEKLAKMGIMEKACEISEIKESKLMKKTDGSKSKTIRGIPKLLDANWAGTDKSKECVLIFCEGDSAKAGIVSGLSSQDRNIMGVYPMKGKLLNVRGESASKISENKEIAEIKKILGLESGKVYNTIDDVHKNLRYSKIVYMTDQDLDGSHIKGLCINLFHSEWPSLVKIPDFLSFMNTPILKCKKGTKELQFFSEGEFNEWKKENSLQGWKTKYYKGLGTSTANEFREYFREKRIVHFEYTGEPSDQSIDMIFNKKKPHLRKDWLGNYSRELYLDTKERRISYEKFINYELIHFSKYDCERNIPNLMDGLKTSLRKILFSAFKKRLTTEVKVAQFSGYVSENSGYHHGEASLNGAIVGMAQTFVGSNNINLLMPNGQMGTRLRGGQDSASERYIFTQLNPLTRFIFREEDDAILDYLCDDGLSVEPVFYAPIIPMILVNGTKGIGTGFSTEIMSYNPLDITSYLKAKLLKQGTFSKAFVPYYEGFKGVIQLIDDGNNRVLIKGVYEVIGADKIRITELPVGMWTYDFKEYLEALIDKKTHIKDYNDLSTDVVVNFTVIFQKGKLQELAAEQSEHFNGVEKLLKLYSINSMTNMHLFNVEEKLVKFSSIVDIIDSFMETRLGMYVKRKEHLLGAMLHDLEISENKLQYIQQTLEGSIDLRNMPRAEIQHLLESKQFKKIDDSFKYLLQMTMESVSLENVEHIIETTRNLRSSYESLASTSVESIWLKELNELESQLVKKKKQI